ncbi:Hypothetical predicted protein [Cloeon dipterum]|uniref:Uncharacterized protein n=1 Tax=Cloeon dipterum TaxID=197152 RepID=A0A8S1E4N3_9INSE|nr:Hypothetical predicted protein [Cloeon dipterum]
MHQFGSGFASVLHIIRTIDIVTCCGKFVRWYTSNSLFMDQVGHVIQVKSLFPCVAKPPEDMHQFGSGFASVLHIIRTIDIVTCCGKFVRWYTSNSLFMAQVGHVIQVKSLFPCVAKPSENVCESTAKLVQVLCRSGAGYKCGSRFVRVRC